MRKEYRELCGQFFRVAEGAILSTNANKRLVVRCSLCLVISFEMPRPTYYHVANEPVFISFSLCVHFQPIDQLLIAWDHRIAKNDPILQWASVQRVHANEVIRPNRCSVSPRILEIIIPDQSLFFISFLWLVDRKRSSFPSHPFFLFIHAICLLSITLLCPSFSAR